METQESEFKSTDGLKLFYRRWSKAGAKPKRLVVAVHGFADHTNRMPWLIPDFVDNGALVYGYDQRGNGKSDGKRGHIMAYSELVNDLDTFLREVVDRDPEVKGLERVLFSHSTGGILALTYMLEHPGAFDRAVLSAPALILAVKAPGWKKAMGNLLSGLAPTVTLDAGYTSKTLSRDPEFLASTDADPLITHDISTRFYKEVYVTAAPAAMARISELKVPFFYIHGGADPLIDVAVAEEFRKHATAPHEIVIMPGSLHEWFNDIDRDKGFAQMNAWLEAPVKAAVAAH